VTARSRTRGNLAARCGTVLAVGVAGAMVTTEAQAAAPANDDFATPTVLVGEFGHVRSSNAEASKEPGEPDHAGVLGNKSVWYTWTAPKDGQVVVETQPRFDSLLAVYQGQSLDALTKVAANDDRRPGGWWGSRLTFLATAGASYAVAVDGVAGKSGKFVLSWAMRPQNDDFATAQQLAGESGAVRTDTSLATNESGEPRWHRRSVWYRWTAPASGELVLRTGTTLSYNFIVVYRGNSLENLRVVAPSHPRWGYFRVRLSVREGRTYRIMLGNWGRGAGPTGLRWRML
jgi:hypothetical protein